MSKALKCNRCDRCWDPTIKYASDPESKRIHIPEMRISDPEHTISNTLIGAITCIDLCPTCTQGYIKWFDAPRGGDTDGD